MSKAKTRWVCQECGFWSSRFLGRCTDCLAWNSFAEELTKQNELKKERRSIDIQGTAGPTPLSELAASSELKRYLTGFSAVDGVLGGGIVPGSMILLAGDPGVGKSTLLLQMASTLAQKLNVLYVSGEESKQQVGLRSLRLGINSAEILVDSEQNVLNIENQVLNGNVQFAIVDSIQAVYHPYLESAPGSVGQVRESANCLMLAAKSAGVATVVVGHVTKDGSIAGPRVLEHMVDVVLQFEGEKMRQLRVLRAAKNRFGSTEEIAIFNMLEYGLQEIADPSWLFLSDRLNKSELERSPSGTGVFVGLEGSKALILEVQALVSVNTMGSPRRVANGVDLNRLLMILAVLDKRLGLPVSGQDVYVNVVGGFVSEDPAADLAVGLAIASSALDCSVDPYLIAIGEIGLSGEIRPVSNLEKRLKEARRLGFKRALVPETSLSTTFNFDELTVIGVKYLMEAISYTIPTYKLEPKMNLSQT